MILNEDYAAEGKARVGPKVLRSLMRKSDRAGFLQLASHLLAIAASGSGLWMTWGNWLAVPFFIVHGILVNWLYAAQHELCHDTVFRNRWMNEWTGRFTGFVLLFPRDYDRWRHLCHHRHTQDPERDAELVHRSLFKGRFGPWLSLSGISLWLGAAWHHDQARRHRTAARDFRILSHTGYGTPGCRRGALAFRPLRTHCGAVDLVRDLGGHDSLVGANAGDVMDTPDSEHNRT